MDSRTALDAEPDLPRRRMLVVADWAVDPQAVVSACVERQEQCPSEFALVVPSWLHGLDWVGDPKASMLCARQQLDSIDARAAARGLELARAAVIGDPDVLAAICDTLADWAADELLVCSRAHWLLPAHPFDLLHRARRLTGLPVPYVGVPRTDAAGWHRASTVRRNGHCALDQPQPRLT